MLDLDLSRRMSVANRGDLGDQHVHGGVLCWYTAVAWGVPSCVAGSLKQPDVRRMSFLH